MMSMFTSRAHASRQLAGLISAMILLCPIAHLQAQEAPKNPTGVANPDERLKVIANILSVLKNQTDLAGDEPLSNPKIGKRLKWSNPGDGKRLLVPLRITYKHIANSYCRLATASADIKDISLVALPDEVSFDHCTGMETMYLDINGDGILDVIQGIDGPSNRYDVTITVPVVYLSSPGNPAGYCYSRRVSEAIEPVDIFSEATLAKKIRKIKPRLDLSSNSCD